MHLFIRNCISKAYFTQKLFEKLVFPRKVTEKRCIPSSLSPHPATFSSGIYKKLKKKIKKEDLDSASVIYIGMISSIHTMKNESSIRKVKSVVFILV